MGDPMRIRAVAKGGSVIVKILMSHPMETGQRKGSDGKRIPPHFIQHVSATWQGRPCCRPNGARPYPRIRFSNSNSRAERRAMSSR